MRMWLAAFLVLGPQIAPSYGVETTPSVLRAAVGKYLDEYLDAGLNQFGDRMVMVNPTKRGPDMECSDKPLRWSRKLPRSKQDRIVRCKVRFAVADGPDVTTAPVCYAKCKIIFAYYDDDVSTLYRVKARETTERCINKLQDIHCR